MRPAPKVLNSELMAKELLSVQPLSEVTFKALADIHSLLSKGEKLDYILLHAGTTGERQVWFTRPEVKKAVNMALDAAGDWQQYAKEGETAEDAIKRNRRDDASGLLSLLAKERKRVEEWEENARYLLDSCPGSIRAKPGGGSEVLLDSMITTFIKLRNHIGEPDVWRPIIEAPISREMIVVKAIDVVFHGRPAPYTSDPYVVWREAEDKFARWPHQACLPTHFMRIPK